MDIKKLGQEISSPIMRNGEKKVQAVDQDFKKILEGLTETASGDRVTSEIAPPASFSIAPLNFVRETPAAASGVAESVKATESVLDTLEEYQKALGDPGVTLKEMDGLVQTLARKTNELNDYSERLSSGDPLRGIMTEVGSVSAVELEKFHQGRYV